MTSTTSQPMTGWAENCRIWGSNRRRGPNAGGKVSQQEVSVMAGEPGMEVSAADCQASGCLTDQARSSSLLEEEGGA